VPGATWEDQPVTGTPSHAPATAPPSRRARLGELTAAVVVAAAVAAAGAPLALLWSAVAPHAPFVMTQYGPTTTEPEPEQFVAGDGWYVLLGLGYGVLVAVLAWALLRRYRGPVLLAGLTLGAVVAGVLTAWLGHRIGLDEYRRLLSHAAVGQRFNRPVDARTKSVGLWFGFLPRVQGVVLVPAIIAAAVYTLLAGFHPAPDLDRGDAEVSTVPAPPGAEPGGVASAAPAPPDAEDDMAGRAPSS
jgi:uncharacterized protein DUF2567